MLPHCRFVASAALPDADFELHNSTLTVTGWGYTNGNDTPSYVLRETQLNIISHEECFKAFEKAGLTLGQGQVCTSGHFTDACKVRMDRVIKRQQCGGLKTST